MSGRQMVHDVFTAIDACGVIAILRNTAVSDVAPIVSELIHGGVTALEVSLTTPDADRVLAEAVRAAGTSAVVGAGTVLTLDDVDRVTRAGARFVVAPVLDLDVLLAAHANGLATLPGVYTPSEAVMAIKHGGLAAKLFPAETIDPAFVRAVRIPLPTLRMVPTGGITLDRAAAFRAAGAWAVGVGSPLFRGGPIGELHARARAFVATMRVPA